MDYKLYQYQAFQMQIENIMEDDEITDEQRNDLLVSLLNNNLNIKERLEDILKYRKNLEYFISSVDKEVERLKERKERMKKKLDKITSNVVEYMKQNDIEKMDCDFGRCSLRKSYKTIVVDPKRLPSELKEVIIDEKINLNDVKEWIKEGKLTADIAYLEENKSLQVK